jgi:hypothetical protein
MSAGIVRNFVLRRIDKITEGELSIFTGKLPIENLLEALIRIVKQ